MNKASLETGKHLSGRRHLLQRWGAILLSVLVLVLLLWIPLPDVLDSSGALVPLSQDGRTTMAILALCLVLWTTEAIPFAIAPA